MRPVLRFQSQLLYRKSYKPNRLLRVRPETKASNVFRPSRVASAIDIKRTIRSIDRFAV